MTRPGKVGVYHPGTQHSWQTALAFQEKGLLAWYATSIFHDPARLPYSATRWMPDALRRRAETEFLRRDFPPLDKALVHQTSFWEWVAVPLRRARLWSLARHAARASSHAGARQVEALFDSNPVAALWTYDSVGLEALRAARTRGIPTILDQTVGHIAGLDKAMRAEAERRPELFPRGYAGMPAEVLERQAEELEIADAIVVGSDFARGTLLDYGVPAEKLHVLRYGYDETLFRQAIVRPQPVDRPVRFLCVGLVGPRKGTAHLIEAFETLAPERAELTIIGPLEIDPSALPKHGPHIRLLPSVARNEMPALMAQADCLILPSLYEGCSISLHEGIGSGLPIIHSASSGDGLVDGNGMILPAVSSDAIRNAVETLLREPHLIPQWSRRSVELASHHSSVAYRQRVVDFYADHQGAGLRAASA